MITLVHPVLAGGQAGYQRWMAHGNRTTIPQEHSASTVGRSCSCRSYPIINKSKDRL